MKKIFVIALAALMMTMLLVGCGDKQETATPDSSATSSKTAEISKIIETTSHGGTVEQDSEGNIIGKDKNGEIVSVKDKDGNPIEITEYITTHTYVVEGSGDSDDSGSSGSDTGSSSKTDEGSQKDSASASIPEENLEEYELPII